MESGPQHLPMVTTALKNNGDAQAAEQKTTYEDSAPAIQMSTETAIQIGGCVKALYGNESTDHEELSFDEGDIMQVEQVVSTEWLLCLLYGQRGLVPVNYVAIM